MKVEPAIPHLRRPIYAFVRAIYTDLRGVSPRLRALPRATMALAQSRRTPSHKGTIY
ncbi:hypothetical protein FIBSPDRAFT_862927 [Athelia psychrophila]|uniref:Uncharacterized protein n=1 Tax=Athelia psychrophila TaxID=1759441 RepID=A0A166HVB5_9AGAM|nr:hypothetical protein FIBSPDRAFT_862927 [Fibularhizoctonia sp. CBS 109695]